MQVEITIMQGEVAYYYTENLQSDTIVNEELESLYRYYSMLHTIDVFLVRDEDGLLRGCVYAPATKGGNAIKVINTSKWRT